MKKLLVILFILSTQILFSQNLYKNNIGINLVSQRPFIAFELKRMNRTNFPVGISYIRHFDNFDARFNLNYFAKKDNDFDPTIDDGLQGEINIKEFEIIIGLRKVLSEKKLSPYLGTDFCSAYVIDKSEIGDGWGGYSNIEKYSWRYGMNLNFGLLYSIKDNINLSVELSLMYYKRTHDAYLQGFWFVPLNNFAISYDF